MVNYFLLDFVSISVLLFIKFTIYQVFLKLVFVLALIFSYEAHKETSASKTNTNFRNNLLSMELPIVEHVLIGF